MLKKGLKTILAVVLMVCTFTFCAIPVQAESDVTAGIDSDYAYVIDYQNNQVLGQKNASARMYPASMTKMMTAILALENLSSLDQKITITETMLDGLAEMNASVAGFKVNDTPTVRDLLYGIALPSGADAANAVAVAVAGSVDKFVAMMNAKAKEIGMNDTHFVNTTGLHDDNHYSTAIDIATLLRYCLNNSTFVQVFSAKEYTTTALASNANGIALKNSAFTAAEKGGYDIHEMIGAKTGFTLEGAHCMASWSLVNEMPVIVVTAHADTDTDGSDPAHIRDLATILSALRKMQSRIAASPEITVKTIKLKSIIGSQEYDVVIPDTIRVDTVSSDSVKFTTDLPDTIDYMNDVQTINYTLTVTVNGEEYETHDYSFTIEKDSNLFSRIIRGLIHLFQ